MAVWPADLPQLVLLAARRNTQNGTLRTAMDAGPPKVRRKFTATTKRITTPMVLSGEDYATLMGFYESTLNGGVDTFDWTDPIDDTDTPPTVQARIVRPPVFSVVAGNKTVDESGDAVEGFEGALWSGNVEFEILP